MKSRTILDTQYSILTLLFLIYNLLFGIYPLLAQDNNDLVSLSKQVIEAKSDKDIFLLLEEIKDLHFSRRQYPELIDFLKSLSKTKKAFEPFTNYYIAVSGYGNLKHLEESQQWNEYFSNINAYRSEIAEGLEKAINQSPPQGLLHLYSRLLLWQFNKDMGAASEEESLAGLMDAALKYAQTAEYLKPLKDAADKLAGYLEAGKAKELYKIYLGKLIASDIKEEELSQVASDLYNQGSLKLSQMVYDLYIERIVKSYPKEKSMPILTDIARLFSESGEGRKDEFYAEGVFEKIEETAGKEFFTEELICLRALNLEKIKDYHKAKDAYIELIRRYPSANYADTAGYKLGIISSYVLRDVKAGKEYFQKLASREKLSRAAALSLYQLGLFSQWEEDFVKAKDYYNKLLEPAFDNETAQVKIAVQERLAELNEGRPLEYNLKIFLDTSLREEYASFDASKVGLKASSYTVKAGQDIEIHAAVHTAESGCLQPDLRYLWSGDLGEGRPSTSQQAEFNTSYKEAGTKIIHLVVVSPAGIIDRAIDIIDIR